MHISCTICTELYQPNEQTGVTKCGHLFHIECVKPWLEKHKTCPHCRSNCLVIDLIKVFFTESSSEDVHLNRNCKTEALNAMLNSQKEHIKQLKLDLTQSENDLIDMNKHIEVYDNEIRNLKILNDSLLENNEKVELENKLLIDSSKLCNLSVQNLSNIDVVNDIVELKTIIASYEEANLRHLNEIKFLEKQNSIIINQNEELNLKILKKNQEENHKLIEDNKSSDFSQNKNSQRKNIKLKKSNVLNETSDVDSSQSFRHTELQNAEKSPSCTTESKIDRKASFAKAKKEIEKLITSPTAQNELSHGADNSKEKSDSFRKAREQIVSLNIGSIPRPIIFDKVELNTEKRHDNLLAEDQNSKNNIENNQQKKPVEAESKNNDVFVFDSYLEVMNELVQKPKDHLIATHPISLKTPIPPSRSINRLKSLPPSLPPRRADKFQGTTNKLNKTVPVGSIPLFGLCESFNFKFPAKEAANDVKDKSSDEITNTEDISLKTVDLVNIENINKTESNT